MTDTEGKAGDNDGGDTPVTGHSCEKNTSEYQLLKEAHAKHTDDKKHRLGQGCGYLRTENKVAGNYGYKRNIAK